MKTHERKKIMVVMLAAAIFLMIFAFWIKFRIQSLLAQDQPDQLVQDLSQKGEEYRDTGWRASRDHMNAFLKNGAREFGQLVTQANGSSTATSSLTATATSSAQ